MAGGLESAKLSFRRSSYRNGEVQQSVAPLRFVLKTQWSIVVASSQTSSLTFGTEGIIGRNSLHVLSLIVLMSNPCLQILIAKPTPYVAAISAFFLLIVKPN